MQVPVPEQQHRVMIEAVENHMPEVIVIDEIGSEAEALAAATIAQRGVQLVATAHGERLENILNNPTLQSLLGGVERQVLHVRCKHHLLACFDACSSCFIWLSCSRYNKPVCTWSSNKQSSTMSALDQTNKACKHRGVSTATCA